MATDALAVTYTWVPIPTRPAPVCGSTTVIARTHEAARFGAPGHLLVTVPIISVDCMTAEEQAALVPQT